MNVYKEVVVSYFKVLSRNSFRGPNKSRNNGAMVRSYDSKQYLQYKSQAPYNLLYFR
jgi:hypothetical protein